MAKSKTEYEVHPASELFPWMGREEFNELKRDIKENGVRFPVIFHKGQLLDGRNRMAACEELKVKCPREEYKGKDPIGFIISSNINRRHLTDDQRITLVAKLRAGDLSKAASARMKSGKKGSGELPREAIAREAKSSEHKARAAMDVVEHDPDEAEKVIAGKAKLSAAAKKARQIKSSKPGKTRAKPAKPVDFKEVVKRKWQRFIESFSPTQYRQVIAIVKSLLGVRKAAKAKRLARKRR
jgi:hypothetical protein